MNIKILFSLYVWLLLSFQGSLLSHITDIEIEKAYMTLFSKEFGYTLIGEKPVSIEEGFISEYLYSRPDILNELIISLKESLQSSKVIIFKAFNENKGSFFLEIIHKPALMHLVSQNTRLQAFIKLNFQSVEEFYRQVEDPCLRLIDVLQNNAYFKGIVLGYGDANASYFCRRCELANHLKIYPFVRLVSYREGLFFRKPNFPSKIRFPHRIKEVYPSPGFSSLKEEWRWMKDVWWELRGEREAAPPFFIALPFYICRYGGDSELVRDKYKRASIKLAELFSGKSVRQAVEDAAIRR